MARIKLTKGKFAIVDDADFSFLNQYNWQCDSSGYAVRDIGGRKDKKRTLMHRLINKTPNGFHTDHINRDKLDNRKENLRTTTPSQNILNSKLSKNNTSGYKGISWYKNRWAVRIKFNYKGIYLGRFKLLSEALNTRKLAEQKYGI